MVEVIVYFILLLIVLYILFLEHTRTETNKKTTKIEDKINELRLHIIEIERKIAYVEDTHGYTSVTTMLRYDIENTESEIDKLKRELISTK